MGAAVEIKLQEIDKLQRKLNEFVLSGGDKAGLLNSLGMVIEEQTKSRFDVQRDPEGDPWKELTEAYKERKGLTSSGGILVREGFLQMAIEHQLKGGDTVLVGSPREYAPYHQEGTKKMPARKFLGFGTDDITELQDAVDEFMKEQVA